MAMPTNITRRRALRAFAAAVAGVSCAPGSSAQTAGTPEATPVQGSGAAVSETVEFALSGGVMTQGQFDYPAAGTPPFPAVLFLQGSGPVDRDETLIEPDGTVSKPFLQLSQALIARGIAVLRYDKRGVCPPSRPCDPVASAAQSKPILTEDAALAYARMIANPRIDADRTAVLGHSEGTWLAPALAQRFPDIRALVLIGTGLGPMHVLSYSQVTLPLLGAALYDADGDGALVAEEVAFTDPAAIARFQERIRDQGRIFLLQYEGGENPRPIGLNPRIDANGDGKIDLLTELRPVYETMFANIAAPLPIIERYADPAVLPIVSATLGHGFDTRLYASYQDEPLDASLRTLLNLASKPQILIVNGEHDDQTPASSARLLANGLADAGFPVTLLIYPGLSHTLSSQADMFAAYGAAMQPGPAADIAAWLEQALRR
jgi:pimeloyl-ACP methyl ester carboxylesterase